MLNADDSRRPGDRRAGPPVLEAAGITKRYGAVRALTDVSITVPAGAIVSIVGENGAGKSTLVRIIAGLEQPDSGELRLDGAQVSGGRIERQRQGIRIAPQELLLCPNLSVAENIFLGALPRGDSRLINRGELQRAARDRLASLGMSSIPVEAAVEGLPVVAKAFVQIARAMADGARVLVVDEPTAPMSGTEVDTVLSVLEGIAATGTAILYISHRLDEVLRISDRVVVLRDGRKAAEFLRGGFGRRDLARAMVGSRETQLTAAAPARDAADAPVLSVSGISGGTVAPTDLHVRAGEIVAVYGVLGSGRDELASLIVGARKPDSGTVTVGDTRLAPGNIRSAIMAGIGFVPAERRSQGLALELTVRQNLTLGILPKLRGSGRLFDRSAERAITRQWIDRLEISAASVDTPVSSLSGGGQQKVLIARWLADGSRILILEEPTRGVDIATKASIYQLLRDQAAAGCAILVLSSDLEEVAALHTRVLVMVRGQIASEQRQASQRDIAAAALGLPGSEDK